MIITPLLAHASDTDLASAVEANFQSWFRSMVHALSGELEKTPTLNRYHCTPGSAIFKGVWGARLAPDEVDATIDNTIAWFKSRNAPFFFWWIGDDTKPSDLGERLKARGFADFDTEPEVAMAADIEQLNWNNPRPPDLRIDPVMNEEQLLQWKRVFLESFGIA